MSEVGHWLAGRHCLVIGDTGAAAVAAWLEGAGARVTREAGLVEDADIAGAFDAAERTAPVDLLVHAGAGLRAAVAEGIRIAEWRATVSADLDGRFLFAAEFARRRIAAQGGGSILFLMPGPAPADGRAAVATAHGAIDNLVKTLAVEWGRDGIRVNAIASRAAEDGAGADAQAALGALAGYLLSDYAAYVTGCVMGVDEG